jgi:hypothetical protein
MYKQFAYSCARDDNTTCHQAGISFTGDRHNMHTYIHIYILYIYIYIHTYIDSIHIHDMDTCYTYKYQNSVCKCILYNNVGKTMP